MKNNLLLFLLLFLLPGKSFSQTDSVYNKIISFVPQYLINNGIRIDYEINLSKNHWIQLCPQFYLSQKNNNSDYNNDFTEVAGVGLQAYHKIYLNNNYQRLGTYFSYGLAYNFFNIKYNEDVSGKSTEESTQINKIGGDIIIGYQYNFAQRLVLDLYGGVGGRYSKYKYSGITTPKYNDTWWSYGYTGNILIMGFRLGINF